MTRGKISKTENVLHARKTVALEWDSTPTNRRRADYFGLGPTTNRHFVWMMQGYQAARTDHGFGGVNSSLIKYTIYREGTRGKRTVNFYVATKFVTSTNNKD